MLYTSTQNNLIKRIASYKDKKYRSKDGKFLIEGIKMVREAVKCGYDLELIIGLKDIVSEFNTNQNVLECDEKVIKYLSDSVTPQGVIGVANVPKTRCGITGNTCVLLDGIQDPGNMGTIIRTLSAVGVKDIITINCVDVYSPKTVRSSMSGIYFVNIIDTTYNELDGILGDIPIITADMGGQDLYGFTPPEKYCLVIGNEANGVSDYIKNKSKYIVGIPMQNTVESLNAGVSLSVMIYQFTYGVKN